jgi:hypothetical protein
MAAFLLSLPISSERILSSPQETLQSAFPFITVFFNKFYISGVFVVSHDTRRTT